MQDFYISGVIGSAGCDDDMQIPARTFRAPPVNEGTDLAVRVNSLGRDQRKSHTMRFCRTNPHWENPQENLWTSDFFAVMEIISESLLVWV